MMKVMKITWKVFSGTECEHDTLKNKLIKIISQNSNEACSNEEDMIQEEEEVLNHNQEVSHSDEEIVLKNAG